MLLVCFRPLRAFLKGREKRLSVSDFLVNGDAPSLFEEFTEEDAWLDAGGDELFGCEVGLFVPDPLDVGA